MERLDLIEFKSLEHHLDRSFARAPDEMDDAAMETFSRGLAEETGALPPPHIVVEAIKQSQSADPRKISDAVRAHYRRARPRPPVATPA